MNFSKLPLVALSGLMLAAGVAHAADTTTQNDSVKAGAAGEPAARQKLLHDADQLIKSGKAE